MNPHLLFKNQSIKTFSHVDIQCTNIGNRLAQQMPVVVFNAWDVFQRGTVGAHVPVRYNATLKATSKSTINIVNRHDNKMTRRNFILCLAMRMRSSANVQRTGGPFSIIPLTTQVISFTTFVVGTTINTELQSIYPFSFYLLIIIGKVIAFFTF